MQCKIFTYISYIFYRYAGQSYLAYMYGPNGDEKNKVNYHTNAWGVWNLVLFFVIIEINLK